MCGFLGQLQRLTIQVWFSRKYGLQNRMHLVASIITLFECSKSNSPSAGIGSGFWYREIKMSEQQIIARLVELFRDPALDNDDSPESQEFDRLEAEFVARFGESEFTFALDRLLGHLMEL